MGKASRKKQLKRAGLWKEKPKGDIAPGHGSLGGMVDIDPQDLPEDIRREFECANEGEEEQRTIIRAYKEVDRHGDIVSYGVVFDDGDGQAWSA